MRWDEMLFAAQTFRCFWKRDLGRRWWQPSQSRGWGPVQGGGKGVLEVCTPILDTAGCCLGLSPVIPTWKAASYTNSHIPPPRADAGGAVWSLWCQHVSTHACLQLATPWWGWGAPCPPLCLAPGGCGSLLEARSLRGTSGGQQGSPSLAAPFPPLPAAGRRWEVQRIPCCPGRQLSLFRRGSGQVLSPSWARLCHPLIHTQPGGGGPQGPATFWGRMGGSCCPRRSADPASPRRCAGDPGAAQPL